MALADDLQLSVIPLKTETQHVLVPATLGILVNKNDPKSLKLAQHYASMRRIPASNIVSLDLPLTNDVSKYVMSRALTVLQQNPNYSNFVGFALAFQKPFRVAGNQSITSAVSDGVSNIIWKGSCNPTLKNPDFSGSVLGKYISPLTRKPAMMLIGGATYDDSYKLLERGLAADNSDPTGQVYLIKTTDAARSSPREFYMELAKRLFERKISITIEKNNNFANKNDVFVFQTGLAKLPSLNTLNFMPGAYADHLTSTGGFLFGANAQTPATELMQAGATASFGTVREPCNFTQKFPNPAFTLNRYLRGDSLLEAYWRGLQWTTEGVLVGEPLARPFPIVKAVWDGNTVTFTANRRTAQYFRSEYNPVFKVTTQNLRVYQVQSGHPVALGILFLPAGARIVAGRVLGTMKLVQTNAVTGGTSDGAVTTTLNPVLGVFAGDSNY
ncbi:MAG: TIGR03790 family protein [Calothrix sp. SM1_5_4]|nr:TIGR03790 family protein [Calothrix sp. SM1_5_4]